MAGLRLLHRSIHSADLPFGMAGGLEGARYFLVSGASLVLDAVFGVTAEAALGADFAAVFLAAVFLAAVVATAFAGAFAVFLAAAGLAAGFATDLTTGFARGFAAGFATGFGTALAAGSGAAATSFFRIASRDSIIGFDWLAIWVKN